MALARLARLLVFTAATAFAVTLVSPAFAQAPAAPAAAAKPKKYIPPVKGVAKVQMTKPAPKPDGKDIVTVIKIKNMMEGTIAGLRVDEYWYDKANKMVAGDTQRVRTPIQPGEIVTITLRTPRTPGMNSSQYQISHANGTIKAEAVSKIE
ncbi:MAG: hypothetical protein JNM38_21510 [Acidobacteria bacterium]|nr:hypothetical protein [Acidobacteriota bacterium]